MIIESKITSDHYDNLYNLNILKTYYPQYNKKTTITKQMNDKNNIIGDIF